MIPMSENLYWVRRAQKEQDKWLDKKHDEWTAQLAKVYRQAARSAQLDILEACAKLQEDNEKGEILINDLYRSKRYKALLNRLSSLLVGVGKQELQIIEPAILETFAHMLGMLDLETPSDLLDMALFHPAAIEGRQVALQSWCADGLNYSGRIWRDKDRMLKRLEKSLTESIINGYSPYKTAEALSKDLGVAERAAYRLMRTETAHAQIAAQTFRYKQYGFNFGKFHANPACCPHCQDLDNQVHPIDEFTRLIPDHPNCRCNFTPIREVMPA